MAQEIHQYYFERYLRNEMPIKEKLAFETRLKSDMKARSAFEHYKLNRQEYLSDYATTLHKSSSNRKLNNWIYLLISVIGILITTNLYLANRQLKHLMLNPAKDSLPFYKRIPFVFGNTPEKQSRRQVSTIQVDSLSEDLNETDSLAALADVFSSADSLDIDYDVMLADSGLPVYDRSSFDQVYEKLRQFDSTLTDSELERMTMGQMSLPEFESKTGKIKVEYWKSPVGYDGYVYYPQKKLILYGHEPTEKMTLLKSKNELGLRLDEGNIYRLNNDGNFHKF